MYLHGTFILLTDVNEIVFIQVPFYKENHRKMTSSRGTTNKHVIKKCSVGVFEKIFWGEEGGGPDRS